MSLATGVYVSNVSLLICIPKGGRADMMVPCPVTLLLLGVLDPVSFQSSLESRDDGSGSCAPAVRDPGEVPGFGLWLCSVW